MLKRICGFAVVALIASTVLSADNWQSKVGDASSNAAVVKETMKGLSSSNQLAFVQAVNEAIAAKTASSTEKAKLFTEVANAALESANRDIKTKMLAEIFATATPEALTVINENLAKGALAKGTMADGDFASRARGSLTVIADRCSREDAGTVRDTFAILAFARGAGGAMPELANQLADAKLGADAAVAKESWIPAAMDGDYGPLLGAAAAGEEPSSSDISGGATASIMYYLYAETATGVTLPTGSFINSVATDFGLDSLDQGNINMDQVPAELPEAYPNQN